MFQQGFTCSFHLDGCLIDNLPSVRPSYLVLSVCVCLFIPYNELVNIVAPQAYKELIFNDTSEIK